MLHNCVSCLLRRNYLPPVGSLSDVFVILPSFPGVLPKYFSSEWSFAQFHLPEETQFVAAFGSQNTVLIIGMDGR